MSCVSSRLYLYRGIAKSHPLDIERGPTKLYWYAVLWRLLAIRFMKFIIYLSPFGYVSQLSSTLYSLYSLTTPEPEDPNSTQEAGGIKSIKLEVQYV